jgi:ABC-type transport system involved in Fe-S cluster assembly fused permease/ATPase subunit
MLPHCLWAQIGIVVSNAVFFDPTIVEETAYGGNMHHVPLEDIVAAAEKVNVLDFISSFLWSDLHLNVSISR